MQKLKTGLKTLLRYPLILLFFGFLFLFTLVDFLKPSQEFSELENRRLLQAPTFNLTSLVNNEWTLDYGEYIREQFIFRDGWILTQSALEVAQGKLEHGGAWYAKDDYQIAKNSIFSPAQARILPINTQSVAELAQRHEGKVQVMVVPSPANVLADKLRWGPPQMDENTLLDTLFAELSAAGANGIDLREAFIQADAAGQQVYYRTDHHWTTTGGALLAYQALCEATGKTPTVPSDALLVDVEGFLGTNYAKTLRPFTRPDTLRYYDLPNPMTIYKPQTDGGLSEQQTDIMDKSQLDKFDKYAAFLHGNNGYSVIEGNGEGSILVIKDSYGNCFVPYLVESYAQVGVIDLRDWVAGIDSVIEQDGYDDILVLYSFPSFTEDTYLSRLATEKQS
ncbi:MAG: DHHW family protein [Oscillospiraceae bacterium]